MMSSTHLKTTAAWPTFSVDENGNSKQWLQNLFRRLNMGIWMDKIAIVHFFLPKENLNL